LSERFAIFVSQLNDNVVSMRVRENLSSVAAAKVGCTGSVASVAALLAALAWFATPAEAETMVRYNHPVMHNGHRVLYHGAWRGGDAGAAHHKAKASAKDDSEDDSEDDSPKKGALSSPHEFIVLVDTDDSTSLRMATELVNAAKGAGLKAHAWAGKTSPGALAKFVESDGGDFAVTTIDVLAADPKAADLRARSPLVARLANEPVVVIARAGVDDVKQLDGRPVSFGEADGVIDVSGQSLFARLGVAPKVVHEKVEAALASLTAGKLDAIVMLGADESRAVNEAAKSGKLRALSIPWRDELADRYAPARLSAKDLPGLASADAVVDTIGVPFGVVAIDAADGSQRATQDAPFVAAMFERHQPLLGAGADPKWREVNLGAETDWPRLAPARDWIAKHSAGADPALDRFRATAKTADSGVAAPALADKLYDNLLRSGGGAQ
jgi:TRAP-type uncharacterized transport system substrate-binding protein